MKRLMKILLVGGVIALTSCATQNVAIVGEGEGADRSALNEEERKETVEREKGIIIPEKSQSIRKNANLHKLKVK